MIERMTTSLGGGGDAREDASGEKFAGALPLLPLAGMASAAELVGLLASAHARELRQLSETAPAGDPRIALMERRSTIAKAAAAGLAFEAIRQDKIAEPAPDGGYLLHGHVLTPSGGAAAAIVSALENGKRASDFAEAKTDGTGYFRFFSDSAKSTHASQTADSPAPAKGAKTSPAATGDGRSLELRVVDEKGREIAPRETLILYPGVTLYRTLILSADATKRNERAD